MQARCLCGDTTLKAESVSENVGACHCKMCRKWGGGPFLSVETKEPIVLTPLDNVKVLDSSQWAERGFCKECGTHLFYRLKGKDHYYLPAGLFSEHDFTFDHQVFIDKKPSYYHFLEKTENFTEQQVFEMFGGN